MEDDRDDSEKTLEELMDEDNDPTYVPPPKETRKSERLKGKDRWDFNFFRRNRDNNRIKDEREKKLFYDAIKQHGTKNWRAVAKCLPGKSEGVVKNWIEREKRNQLFELERRANMPDGSYVVINENSRKRRDISHLEETPEDTLTPDQRESAQIEEVLVRRETYAPLDKWMKIIEDSAENEVESRNKKGLGNPISCEKMIPMSLRWIAELEDHPSPEDCGGIDYAAIYRYLAHLSEGEVPPDLDPVSAARITKLLTDLCKLVKSSTVEKEHDYLTRYNGPYTRYRTSENFNDNTKSAKLLGEISRTPGMNPLNLPLELFTDKEIDQKPLVMVVGSVENRPPEKK